MQSRNDPLSSFVVTTVLVAIVVQLSWTEVEVAMVVEPVDVLVDAVAAVAAAAVVVVVVHVVEAIVVATMPVPQSSAVSAAVVAVVALY